MAAMSRAFTGNSSAPAQVPAARAIASGRGPP